MVITSYNILLIYSCYRTLYKRYFDIKYNDKNNELPEKDRYIIVYAFRFPSKKVARSHYNFIPSISKLII